MSVKASKSLLKINSDLFYTIPFKITGRTDTYGGKEDNQLYCKEGPKGKTLLKLYFIDAVSFSLFHVLLLIQIFSLDTKTFVYQGF